MESKQRSIGRNMMFNSVGSLFYLVCQWLLTVLVVPLGSFEKAGWQALETRAAYDGRLRVFYRKGL